MFGSRFFSLAAVAGLILVFTSCERHHVGEMPELQQEHFNPRQTANEEMSRTQPAAPTGSVTPANFFPPQKP
jgi:hypothetical protein